MRTLDLKTGNATVEGKVFSFECRETRRPGMWRLSFDMTDFTGSVSVQKNLTEKEAQGLESAVKPGMWLRVQGNMEPTWDGKDIQLNPYHIQLAERGRQDTAPEKRVELHLHTTMSNMDALTDTPRRSRPPSAGATRPSPSRTTAWSSLSRTPGTPPGTNQAPLRRGGRISSTIWTTGWRSTVPRTALWTGRSCALTSRPPASR